MAALAAGARLARGLLFCALAAAGGGATGAAGGAPGASVAAAGLGPWVLRGAGRPAALSGDAAGGLFAASAGGVLSRLGPDGRLAWRLAPPGPTPVAALAAAPGGEFLAVREAAAEARRRRLRVLDGENGRVLCELGAGGGGDGEAGVADAGFADAGFADAVFATAASAGAASGAAGPGAASGGGRLLALRPSRLSLHTVTRDGCREEWAAPAPGATVFDAAAAGADFAVVVGRVEASAGEGGDADAAGGGGDAGGGGGVPPLSFSRAFAFDLLSGEAVSTQIPAGKNIAAVNAFLQHNPSTRVDAAAASGCDLALADWASGRLFFVSLCDPPAEKGGELAGDFAGEEPHPPPPSVDLAPLVALAGDGDFRPKLSLAPGPSAESCAFLVASASGPFACVAGGDGWKIEVVDRRGPPPVVVDFPPPPAPPAAAPAAPSLPPASPALFTVDADGFRATATDRLHPGSRTWALPAELFAEGRRPVLAAAAGGGGVPAGAADFRLTLGFADGQLVHFWLQEKTAPGAEAEGAGGAGTEIGAPGGQRPAALRWVREEGLSECVTLEGGAADPRVPVSSGAAPGAASPGLALADRLAAAWRAARAFRRARPPPAVAVVEPLATDPLFTPGTSYMRASYASAAAGTPDELVCRGRGGVKIAVSRGDGRLLWAQRPAPGGGVAREARAHFNGAEPGAEPLREAEEVCGGNGGDAGGASGGNGGDAGGASGGAGDADGASAAGNIAANGSAALVSAAQRSPSDLQLPEMVITAERSPTAPSDSAPFLVARAACGGEVVWSEGESAEETRQNAGDGVAGAAAAVAPPSLIAFTTNRYNFKLGGTQPAFAPTQVRNGSEVLFAPGRRETFLLQLRKRRGRGRAPVAAGAETGGGLSASPASPTPFLLSVKNAFSGQSVFEAGLPRGAAPPFHLVMAGNRGAVTFRNAQFHRLELFTFELFYAEGAGGAEGGGEGGGGGTAQVTPIFRRLFAGSAPAAFPEAAAVVGGGRLYRLPLTTPVAALGFAATAAGVAPPALLLATARGRLLQLPWALVSPWRPLAGEESDRMLQPHKPALPVLPQYVVSRHVEVPFPRGMLSLPTPLESTGFVALFGLDILATEVLPAGTKFDAASTGNEGLLIVSLVFAAVLCVWARRASARAQLAQKWA